MTRYAEKRCAHCGEVYTRLLSGGHPSEHSDGHYCPECFDAVTKALVAIPRKVRPEWVDVRKVPQFSDVTLEDVLRWDQIEKDTQVQNGVEGRLVVTKLAMPLFDSDDPENRNDVRYVTAKDGPHKGIEFILSTWTKKSDYEIKVCMEVDRDGNHLGLWRNLWA